MFEDLYQKLGFWSKTGPYGDVVLSTRVRLARNLASARFPHKQEESDVQVIRSIARRFATESAFSENLSMVELSSLDSADKRFLRERNIITSEMEISPNSCVIISSGDNFVIMVNEEDHFRIQVIKPGLQIRDTYSLADRVDEEMNKFISYAYSDEYGYLTTCPSNLGTGLRVSTMLHLPTLTIMRSIPDIVRMARDYNADMKGTAGDGARTVGSMYQVSSRVSLGKSEVDILEGLDEVTTMLIEMEGDARDEYLSQYGKQLEDRIWRSYGMVRYSRILGYLDAMEHLSNIRLGVILSILKNIELHKINDLMVNVQWSHLQKTAQRAIPEGAECDIYRADYLRSQFEQAG
jgi:protein arginine kinase